jgi:ATP-dependent Clp protease ATP-binding subunit ClpA
VTSEASHLALILFDEIEKAAPSMTRLLLGVLDKAVLRLGDNTSVNFERTLIFLTSNLGAAAMRKEVLPDFGFSTALASSGGTLRKLSSIGLGAVKRKFAPEFVNRIDAVITYQTLDGDALEAILDQQIAALERHIAQRLEDRAFTLELDSSARGFLLARGTSREYGARELKRVILRKLTQPLAVMVEADLIPPGSVVLAAHEGDAEQLTLSVLED